jgi:hypothetical protein
MTELVELLTEAFEEEPRRPADPELGTGVRATSYWSFAPSLEVVVAESERPPADGQALRAWRTSGTSSASVNSVIAIAKTPSLKATIRPNSTSCTPRS